METLKISQVFDRSYFTDNYKIEYGLKRIAEVIKLEIALRERRNHSYACEI